MRRLVKGASPKVLQDNHDVWLEAWLSDKASVFKRSKYRHPDIKKALKEETSNKCVYCESRLGITSPGQTEHIVPSSKDDSLHFTWANLTRACAECNRRKNDFYQANDGFLNPYVDDVDADVVHDGPIVLWGDNSARAEASVRMLGLNSDRHDLILRKCEFINNLQTQYDRMIREDEPLQSVLRLNLIDAANPAKEYSAMARQFLERKGLI